MNFKIIFVYCNCNNSKLFFSVSKSGIYLNCTVFGSLLIPVKPVRRKRIMDEVDLKLLDGTAGIPTIENPPTPSEVKENVKHEREQSNMGISTTEIQVYLFYLYFMITTALVSPSFTCGLS